MRHSVVYSCGHLGMSKELAGGPEAVKGWIKWAETKGLCPSCYCAEKGLPDLDELSSAARETAKIMGLPSIKGTPKQIRWAETIRIDMITAIQDAAAEIEDQLASGSGDQQLAERLESLMATGAWVNQRFSARWFIDRRGLTVDQLVDEHAAQSAESGAESASQP